MGNYSVWQNAWKDGYDEPLTITLPDNFDVEFHAMGGDDWPRLTKDQIREKIQNPIGMETIRDLAAKGKEAVILFDDLSRGTQCQDIAEVILEELLAGGIDKKHIRFICALGTHGVHNRIDFVRKLGEEIVSTYPVFNHNPFGACVQIGVDKAGVPVKINKEFMDCDVRIGIGSVAPHPMNGYGGGGKLLFPGIAHIDTTTGNHSRREFTIPGTQLPRCGFRQDIEEMTRMVGSFFKIDAVINARLDTVDLYAGEPIAEYYEAAKSSAVVNAMELGAEKDIVIANANAKYNESLIATMIANRELKPGGDIVIINHCPIGQATHYTLGAFGLHNGGTAWAPFETRQPMKCGRLIYYTPWPDFFTASWQNEPDKVIFARTWEEVLDLLSNHGAGTTVSILSDASIGYFPSVLAPV